MKNTVHTLAPRCLIIVATLLIALLGGALAEEEAPPGQWSDTLFVTAGDHFFAPAEITLQAGVPVRLFMTNISAGHAHNALIISDETDSVVGGRLEPISGKATIDWTPPAAGSYRLVCILCGLEQMEATIEVS